MRIFKHYKGNYYIYLGEGKNSETLEEMVVYQALYGDHQVWIRPKNMFFETIEKDGKEIKRFEEVEDYSPVRDLYFPDVDEIKPLEPEFAKIINENFWSLLCESD